MILGRRFILHSMALFCAIIWGTTFVSTKVLLGYGLSPAEILLYRFTLAYIAIWFFSPKRLLAKSWQDELLMACAGLCGGSLYFVAENSALQITLASNVSLILCTAPILTAFILYFFRKEKQLKGRLIIGSIIALTGVALVVYNGSIILKINPLGDALTLTAALLWAFYGLILKQLDHKYPVLFITRKVFIYGVLTLLPVFILQPIETSITTLFQPVVCFNLLFLGLIASMLCYLLWNTAVKELGAVQTSNYIYFMPLITLITSHIVIDETITYMAIIGSLFIISGVYMAEKGVDFLGKRKNNSL
ncbi:DMT family transporter [Parabacteroides sp. OttesenSCG-928-G07]|nr:DMT family transporter [Parabacteroides sp. OttesenSCG-928-G21]MDL2277564.1 DMT family transporter [Parabacteroides sp. OttesenSCG-928-G07]